MFITMQMCKDMEMVKKHTIYQKHIFQDQQMGSLCMIIHTQGEHMSIIVMVTGKKIHFRCSLALQNLLVWTVWLATQDF